jgi:hypothetical protein
MRLGPGDNIAQLVRAATGEAMTLVIDAVAEPLTLTVTTASIGPLAVERAPMRINAVVVRDGADPADVQAAVVFLDSARSTTGQVLWVGQDRVRPQGPSCASTNA